MGEIICLLGSYAPSLIKFRGPLISALVSRGHTVIGAASGIDRQIADQIRALGADPVNIDIARTGTNPFEDLALCRDLTAFFKARKPDVLISYTVKPAIWGSIAAHRAGVPLIAPMITGLGYAFSEARSIRHRLLQYAVFCGYRKALANVQKVFFQNPDDLAAFRKHRLIPDALDAVLINGSGVDIDHFAVVSLPDAPIFLMIARLLKAKGVSEYAEAATMVRRVHPQARFRLVGWIDDSPDAILRSDLDRWIACGLEYIGPMEDVRPAISAASIYVLPSYYGEGIPRSVLEAMAMGRPIITTDAPGCRETVVNGENGILVPIRDPTVLAAAMNRLVADPGLRARMGEVSRGIAQSKYDVHKVNATILTALDL